MTQKTEKEKFMEWMKDQIKNHGLRECRPYLNPDRPADTTEEDIYREMNKMNEAVGRGDYKELKNL
jgi:hypothetical protein